MTHERPRARAVLVDNSTDTGGLGRGVTLRLLATGAGGSLARVVLATGAGGSLRPGDGIQIPAAVRAPGASSHSVL